MPSYRATLAVLLVALAATTAATGADAAPPEGSAAPVAVATRDVMAVDAGDDDASRDAEVDADVLSLETATTSPLADAAPAVDTASEPPLRRGISLSPANADEPTGSFLTRRQWLYVLIGAAIGVLLLMAVPTRT